MILIEYSCRYRQQDPQSTPFKNNGIQRHQAQHIKGLYLPPGIMVAGISLESVHSRQNRSRECKKQGHKKVFLPHQFTK